MTDDLTPGRGYRESASQLRHDLITPLNLIHGYAELLIGDAEDQGRDTRARCLRSIQGEGRRALDLIDETLMRGPDLDHPADLAALADGIVGPSDAIVAACLALAEDADHPLDPELYLEDIGRVREAAVELLQMIRRASEASAGEGG